VSEETKEIRKQMKKASELHGHMGPFLVIGVRIGRAAEQILNPENQQNKELRASVKVPLSTPFSCILDGIQSTTHCTVGNRRLHKKITTRDNRPIRDQRHRQDPNYNRQP